MRPTMLHEFLLLLLALFFGDTVGQNSTECLVSMKSSANVNCSVTKNKCDVNINDGLLYIPAIDNLRVTSEAQEGPSGRYKQSLVHVNWSFPSNFEPKDDFLVQLRTTKNTARWCYLIKLKLDPKGLSSLDFSSEEASIEFKLPLEPNSYSVNVQRITDSSPGANNPYLIPQSVICVKRRVEEYRNIPALWNTDLVLRNDSCNHLVSVTFELAPAEYRFDTYVVLLQRVFSPLKLVVVNTSYLSATNGQKQGSVSFTNLENGAYVVLVYPENTDWRNSSCRCQCRNSKIPACSNDICPGFGCFRTNSSIITIDEVEPGDCTVPYVDLNGPRKLVGIAAGCMMALVILVIIVIVLRSPKYIDIDLNLLPQQPVFLLFANDNKHHQEAIHCLMTVLHRHGNIHIETVYDYAEPAAQNPLEFIHEICTRPNKVLVINSDGLERYLSTSDEIIPLEPLDFLVMPFLTYLRSRQVYRLETDKLVMTRFDYTTTNNVAHEIYYHECEHVLVNDLESLLLHLHGRKKKDGRYVYRVTNIRNGSGDQDFDNLKTAILSTSHLRESDSFDSDTFRTELYDTAEAPFIIPPSLDDSTSVNSLERMEFMAEFTRPFQDDL